MGYEWLEVGLQALRGSNLYESDPGVEQQEAVTSAGHRTRRASGTDDLGRTEAGRPLLVVTRRLSGGTGRSSARTLTDRETVDFEVWEATE